MKLSEIQKAYDDRFEEIQHLLRYIKHAEHNFLDVEFLDSFLQEFQASGKIQLSAVHAAREWDL